MRKTILLLSFLTAGIISSCTKDSDSDSIASIVTQGSWVVHLYTNDAVDETSNYSGYTFTFNSGGIIQATKGSTTYSGLWSEVKDSGKTKFVIVWTGTGIPSALQEIEEDWVVTSKSSTVLELTDSGSAPFDILHFHRK